jgi:hypothetical protein
MSKILKGLSEAKFTDLGPGDEATWPAYSGHPNDPRDPPRRRFRPDEPSDDEPYDPWDEHYRRQEKARQQYKKEVNVTYSDKEGVAPNGKRYNNTFLVKAKTPYQGDNEIYQFNDAHWGAKTIVDTVKKNPEKEGDPYLTMVYYVDNHKHGYWKPWKDEPPISKGIQFEAELTNEGISEQDLADTLFYRLEARYPDIVTRYGHEVVGDAVLDVASFHAGAEELGSSDISIMIREILKRIESRGLDEAQSGTGIDPTSALQQARKITSQFKYADMHLEIITKIQLLAEQAGVDKRDLEYLINDVYEKQRELESAIFALDEPFEELVRKQEWNDEEVDEGQIYSTGGGAGEAQRWYRPKDNLGEGIEMSENLRKWFKEKWVRFGPDGKIRGACARGDDSEGKPKCLPQSKAHSLGKKGRASAAARKRREDPNPERRGPAKNVATKKKSNEGRLNEFAPGADNSGGEEDMLYKYAKMWYNGDLGTQEQIEKILDRMGWEIGELESEEGGAFVVQSGDEHGRSYIGFTAADLTGELDEACWKGYHKEGNKKMFGKTYPNCVKNTNEEEQLDEKCWDTHKQVGMKSKGGKMVPNCVPKESVHEGHQQCPECGGAMYEESMMNEKKDACYYKVKSRYKVWPSAYASGALVKCRKKGASNWGTGGKKNEGMVMGVSSDASSAGSKVQGEASNPAQQAAIAIAMKKAGQKPKRESAIMKGLVDETLGTPYPGTYEQETAMIKRKGPQRITAMTHESKKK